MYLWIKANKTLPLEAIVAATKDNREMFGEAVAFPADGTIIRQVGSLDWADPDATCKNLFERAESFKDSPRLYWFSDAIVVNEQPFSIFDNGEEGKEPTHYMAVACLSGDYEKHDDDASNQSPEFIAFQNLVKPWCDKLVIEAESKPDKFFELMNKNANDIIQNGLFSDDSAMVIMGAKEFFNAGAKESPGKDFTWGHMSDPCGYNEHSAGGKPTLMTTKNSPKLKNVTEEMDKTTGKVVLIRQSPPKSVKKAPDLILWYQTWNSDRDANGKGVVPADFQKRPAVEIDKNKWEADPNFRDVAAGATATTSAGTTVEEKKKPLLKGSATIPPQGVRRVTFVPTLTPKELADLTLGWKAQEFINDSATNAAGLASDELKFPTFEEQAGVSVNDLLKHKPESIEYLVDKHPRLATSLIIELLRRHKPEGKKPNAAKPTLKVK